MQTEINEPKEGDYLSVKQDGEDWPILICDEEMVQTFFTRSPRPGNARQADGTWGKEYKAGGPSISDRRFPAIFLGTLKVIWVPLKGLEPIDIDMGRAIRDSTSNPLLAKAWMEYISQYRGDKIVEWKCINHWKARLHAQRLDKTTPGGVKKEGLTAGKMPEGRKRKGTPKFRYPPEYRNEESDDEESDDLFLKGNTAGPKIKRESNNSISSEEMDALYGDPDPVYPRSSQSSKRSKLDLSGRFSMRPSTPLRASSGRLATPMPSTARHGTPFRSTNQKIGINDPNTVMIYVDNPHKMFKVRRSGLDASPLLSKFLTHHPENGWYIMSPMLSSLDANDFQPVGEYIDRREYQPNILDEGTIHVRLEGYLDPEMLRHEIVRCGTIYLVAQKLEMPGLQDLAFRKLKALASHYQALEILTVIELLFQIGSPEVRQYLTQHVADHYWNLILAETERMVETMRANVDLAKAVFGKLSGQDDKVKMEEIVKEEGKEEAADETKGGGTGGKIEDPSEEGEVDGMNNKAKVDGADEEGSLVEEKKEEAGNQTNKKEKTDETINQTEEEMVKTALRQSDEGQTEVDWVELVQKQSDLFEAF